MVQMVQVDFEGHEPDSLQPYYDVLFNDDVARRILAHLPLEDYDELSVRVEAVLQHVRSTAHQRGAAEERARILAYLDDQAARLRTEPPILPKEARVISTVAAAIRATAPAAQSPATQ